MPCYLCAYQLDDEPESVKELPADAPAWSRYALGTCSLCSVWACALHGTRYGQFECAICTPAVAVQHGLGIGGAPPDDRAAASRAAASASLAYEAGVDAHADVQATVAMVVDGLASRPVDEVSRAEDLSLTRPRSGEPDLILNYAEVIRQRTGVSGDFLPGVDPGWRAEQAAQRALGPEPGGGPRGAESSVSIDAVGAAVRQAYAGRRVEVTGDGILVVTGALLLSMAIAHRPRPVATGPALLEAARETSIARPWEVTHPILLDPVMWVIATAYADRR